MSKNANLLNKKLASPVADSRLAELSYCWSLMNLNVIKVQKVNEVKISKKCQKEKVFTLWNVYHLFSKFVVGEEYFEDCV